MSFSESVSFDSPSGIVINNIYQQSERLLPKSIDECRQKEIRKRLIFFFSIGFVFSAILAIVAYGFALGALELFDWVNNTGTNEQCNKRVIGYHWLSPSDIFTDYQLSKLTHLVFQEADVDVNGTVYLESSDEHKRLMTTNERAQRYKVKTQISIPIRPQFINETESRRTLIKSILLFTHDNHLDGMEFKNRWITAQKDFQNVVEFCKELRQKLQATHTNGKNFIISFQFYYFRGRDVPYKELLKYVDYLNIRTSHYYAPWVNDKSELIGPPTPLYGSHMNSKVGNMDESMKFYSCKTAAPSKLNIMLDFYGLYWKNVILPKNLSDTLWMTAEVKNKTAEGGQIYWKDLKNSKVWDISKASWNEESKTPYIWNTENRTYLAFDNVRSMKEKMNYAIYKNFGGVSIFSLHGDDNENTLLNTVLSEQWCSSEISDEVNYYCD